MKKNSSTRYITFVGFALWFASISCGLLTTSISDVKTESQSVDLGSASTASAQIEFPTGELKVEGGAASLMVASFRYNVSDWKPEVKYSENGTQGDLLISKPGAAQFPVGGELINEWTIQFANDVPLDLTIVKYAGNAELDLGALNLTKLSIQSPTGVTTVNLDGIWHHDLDVTIRGDAGEVTVNLPEAMGVRVDMETGTLVSVTADGLTTDENGYVNKAFGTAPYTLTLKVESDVGSVVLVAP